MRHGGGMTWIPGTYDPELHLYYLGTGNPNPVLTGQQPQGRRSLYLLHRGAECRYGKAGLVFPAVAARHARLGCGADTRADRRRIRGQTAQDAGAGEPERLLLSARPDKRQELADRADDRHHELVKGH